MRLDKFLKLTQLIKRRTVAKEAAEEGVIYINDKPAKPSVNIKAGDIILIDMWNYSKKVKVLKTPLSNNVPKKDIDSYIEVLEYITKNV